MLTGFGRTRAALCRVGMQLAAVFVVSLGVMAPAQAPAPAAAPALARQIGTEHVKALFLDSITDPRAVRRIAEETGAVIGGTLYGDSLSPAGGEADSYIRMLRHDVATLKAGMLKN